MNTTPHPRAILFDWDNTLVDNWPVIRDSMNDALTAMGHPVWTLEETMARVRASLRDSLLLRWLGRRRFRPLRQTEPPAK